MLIPVDASPRLLELLVLLDQHWTFKLQPNPLSPFPPQHMWPYPLCLVSRTGQDMVNFARSLIEWMGGVVKDLGEEEVLEKRGKRKGRRLKKDTLGSEYGALDFRLVPALNCRAYSLFAETCNSSPRPRSSPRRTHCNGRSSSWLSRPLCRTARLGGCSPRWRESKATSSCSQIVAKIPP